MIFNFSVNMFHKVIIKFRCLVSITSNTTLTLRTIIKICSQVINHRRHLIAMGLKGLRDCVNSLEKQNLMQHF